MIKKGLYVKTEAKLAEAVNFLKRIEKVGEGISPDWVDHKACYSMMKEFVKEYFRAEGKG